jgi:hypothetical protein
MTMKVKPGYSYDRGKDQVPVHSVGIYRIMSRPTFALGAADARAGRHYHRDYDLWDVDGQWDYERGRMWAVLAPRNIPLKRDGKINPAAVVFFQGEII